MRQQTSGGLDNLFLLPVSLGHQIEQYWWNSFVRGCLMQWAQVSCIVLGTELCLQLGCSHKGQQESNIDTPCSFAQDCVLAILSIVLKYATDGNKLLPTNTSH
jgi:hypothetical protein